MKIQFVIDSIAASGAELSTAALLPLLRSDGHEVTVVTLYDAGFGDDERLRAEGFEIVSLTSRGFVGRVRELRRRIKADRPDVVHTALFDSDLVGRVAAWRAGPAVVSSLVSTPYEPVRLQDPRVTPWKLRLAQAVDAFTTRFMVDRLHAVSAGVATANARALHIDLTRITVVPRGRSREVLGRASPERRLHARTIVGLAEDAPVVLAVGRQDFLKGHVHLLDAAELLAGEFPDLSVLIAGREGTASDAIRASLTSHPNAKSCTRLLGHRHDIPDLLVAADVLAIPSLIEGTSGVAIEAMALACPVVSSDLPGLAGVLEDGVNAILVPPGSPQALADGLRRVLIDRDLADALRTSGSRDFGARFTTEHAATQMLTLYTDLVRDKGRKGRR